MTKKKSGGRKTFSFESSLERLQEIVSELERGDLSLEENLKHFEEGVKLARDCRDYLESARQRVEVLLGEDEDSNPVIEPYEEDVDEDEED